MSPQNEEIGKPVPYPVSLNLNKIPCLVVGGGIVALRKIESLMACGAKVTVVSPKFVPEVERLKEVELKKRAFLPEDLDQQFLVVSATDDRTVNKMVAQAAKQRMTLVNVVDDPELCNFYVNSQVRRGDLVISVSTGGASPALAKRIRKELESQYGAEYAGFLQLMREYRPRIITGIPDPERRHRVFERLANAGIENIYRERGSVAARAAIENVINEGASTPEK
jgi:precorrin-2 dehydrogenase/sirohydrochlorin ferrochelatase